MVIPNHVAIILDGNGRWAKAKGMPRTYGHVKGCENLEKICSIAKELGVKYLTVYAFSTENWKRSKDEVDGLMKLFRNYMKKCLKIARDNKMRVRVIGEPSVFDEDLQARIRELEEYSSQFDELHFQIALNYGSRDEIRGCRIFGDVKKGMLDPAQMWVPYRISGYQGLRTLTC
ncbi:MAG: polyprenyl diphosphate synthase [Blautia coccoides]